MKTRNLVLASAAFVFAIGGAIASSFALTPVYVKARLVSGGAITCVNTQKQCDIAGTQICQVQLTQTKTGSLGTASTSGTFKTYSDAADCETILHDAQFVNQVSTVQVYELVP